MSRLPLPDTVDETEKPPEIIFISENVHRPTTSEVILKWTLENLVTKQILEWCYMGR